MASKILYGVVKLFSFLPFWFLYAISDFASFILIKIWPYRKDVVVSNLKNSFPEKSEEEIIAIWKKFMRHFTDQMVETLKMFSIPEKEIIKRLKYVNKEVLEKYAKSGQSVMLACGHYGNYEYPSGFPLSIPGFVDYNVIYAPLNSEYMTNKIEETREKFGCNMIKMKESMKVFSQYNDQNHLYGLLFDQSPHFSRVKYDLMFLNQRTPVHLGVENISKMHNCAVLYLEIKRVKRGFYEATLRHITDTPNETQGHEITDSIFKLLEETIKADPYAWLWSHKRWKYKAGEHYNLDS